MNITREKALSLLTEYTQSESLLKHAYGVEASMRWYAKDFDQSQEEIEKWGIAGLLHDFDYEKFPNPDPENKTGHPFSGDKILAKLGYPDDIREAIMGHADFTGVKRESLMAKVLFAVDELSGLSLIHI